MYNSNIPTDRELPSTKKLIKSTIIAVITAVIVLITIVLPSEYGIDPTGVGKVLGLKKMGEIKVSLAQEAAAEQIASQQNLILEVKQTEQPTSKTLNKEVNTDIAIITLAPNQGAEVKVKMSKGAKVDYNWFSDAGKSNFDVHADSKSLNINYYNYEKGSVKTKDGSIIAAFDGYHGWFWRNRTDSNLTITLEVAGDYEYMKRVK